jgi:hypothetical protein
MSKRSFFGSSSDEDKNLDDSSSAQADADAKAEKNNPSTAGTQDPGLQSANQAGVDTTARPVNILPDDRNRETLDDSVNPHNTAAAQMPAVVPLDRATSEEAEAQRNRLNNPKTDTDRKDSLQQWGRDLRLRGGNVTSADWERFQELTGERVAAATPESIARLERERDQGTSDAAQRAPGSAGTDRA